MPEKLLVSPCPFLWPNPATFMAKKILLIDDDSQLIELVAMRLEANEYQVLAAFSGQDGLSMAESEEPDLILLDITMPGMDGLEVLRKLKYNSKTSHIPVVMLTSKTESQAIFRSQELRAVEYIIKPFEPKELLSIIKTQTS